MRRQYSFAWALPVLVALAGCGQADGTGESTQADEATSTPEKAVHEFMLAFKTGDDSKAAALLTQKAREEADRTGKAVSPPGSKTMAFQVGRVRYPSEAEDGAHVECSISDTDGEGQTADYDVIWFLRKEAAGWRVAGILMTVFEDKEPILYNFEDQDDMDRKMELVEQEMITRAQADSTSSNAAALEAKGREPISTVKQ